jgi:hypothetical protein
MRKTVQFALVAVIVLLVGASVVLFQKYQKTSADLTDTKASEEQSRAKYAETIDAIAEIQDSLNTIALGDTAVHMVSQGQNEGMAGGNRTETLDRIALLKASVQRNKEKILALESSLHRSGIKVAGLSKMVANLKKSVDEKEQMVAALSTQVDSLHTQVAGLETTVSQTQDTLRVRDETLEARRRELATIYYAIGTKKDLATAGVLIAKGGVLGMGKTLAPSGRYNDSVFRPLDTDQETVVHTPADKPTHVQVVSAQPPSSYELRMVDGRIELHIIDPVEFRKVKQLVIVTT